MSNLLMKKWLRQLEIEKNRCQSCGMPLQFDPQGGGTESDGSHSRDYCSYCYADGTFKDPQLTLEAMQQRVRQLLRKRQAPWYIRAYMAHRVPMLKRWRSCKR
ncbi:hypothetical protein HF669_10970 [Acidithiobacillus thiooxidans]|nr:zinc ribbon domain-containing protein [Acidithiobacillus sp. HP-11]MBU2742205.1 hypothetical protein [Acidithiobacillus albertensis]MBU2749809.1 hypothetical protein [Acidithiobacillus thiooxidans]MBU2794029.1 hypothetical protein [Acidithiobacillus thiooxidans]MBU2811873.1 hypothetical protein [Acidithiobacillus thiooxidans]